MKAKKSGYKGVEVGRCWTKINGHYFFNSDLQGYFQEMEKSDFEGDKSFLGWRLLAKNGKEVSVESAKRRLDDLDRLLEQWEKVKTQNSNISQLVSVLALIFSIISFFFSVDAESLGLVILLVVPMLAAALFFLPLIPGVYESKEKPGGVIFDIRLMRCYIDAWLEENV